MLERRGTRFLGRRSMMSGRSVGWSVGRRVTRNVNDGGKPESPKLRCTIESDRSDAVDLVGGFPSVFMLRPPNNKK